MQMGGRGGGGGGDLIIQTLRKGAARSSPNKEGGVVWLPGPLPWIRHWTTALNRRKTIVISRL